MGWRFILNQRGLVEEAPSQRVSCPWQIFEMALHKFHFDLSAEGAVAKNDSNLLMV